MALVSNSFGHEDGVKYFFNGFLSLRFAEFTAAVVLSAFYQEELGLDLVAGGVALLGLNLLTLLRGLHMKDIWTLPGCGFASPRLRRRKPAYDPSARKALPRGLTTAVEPRSAEWYEKVEELAHRGFELGDLLAFFAKLGTAELMPYFDAKYTRKYSLSCMPLTVFQTITSAASHCEKAVASE